jgi:hypothetical protein
MVLGLFDAYNKQKQVNPKGSEKGIYHIARGGSFYRLADASTCTARFVLLPIIRVMNWV